MNGAGEYAKLFTTGQYGRLYIVSGSHARGKTFHIFVLPEGVTAKPNGPQNAPLNSDAVEVYGITGGQSGWTETYGWLHEGKWQQDFAAMTEQRKKDLVVEADKRDRINRQRQTDYAERERVLLDNYR